MSERMTDDQFDRRMDAEESKSMGGAARFAWREAHRARAEEARLLEEVAKKNATIKALADALDGLHQVAFRGPDKEKGGPNGEAYSAWCERMRATAEAALCLAGRLP